MRRDRIERLSLNHPSEYYEGLVWKSTDIRDALNIKIGLVPVTSSEETDLFNYFRHTSSMPQFQIPGSVQYLVRDEQTNKYLGIIQLSVDLLKSQYKDAYLGLEPRHRGRLKGHIRKNSANLSICVPLQPFGFNFCGGKLLAMLAFSKEVYRDFSIRKEGSVLAMIVTTSIHGKSVQYDRLEQLKYLGLTHGYGTGHVTDELYDQVKVFVKRNHPQFDLDDSSKHTTLSFALDRLGLGGGYLHHGRQKGIYAGVTGTNSREYLLKKASTHNPDLLKSCDEIAEFWKARWAAQRYGHLKSTGRLVGVGPVASPPLEQEGGSHPPKS